MVSMTDLSAYHGSDLVALLWSIVGKATGALSEHYITLPVDLSQAEIDPQNVGRADFGGITKDVLKENFPMVTDRKAKRQLGSFGKLENVTTKGSLTLEAGRRGSFTITSTAPDFLAALEVVKGGLIDRAKILERQAGLQDNGVREFQRRADATDDEAAKAKALKQVDARSAKRDKLMAEAEDLRARSAAEGGDEKIGRKEPSLLINVGEGWLKMDRVTPTGGTGKEILPIGDVSAADAGEWSYFVADQPEISRKVSDNQVVWLETLREQGSVEKVFNTRFFTTGDSREPELAGLWGAIVGSFWTMLVTFIIAFPIGVLTAIYLEEFAPKTRFTDIIEVNINNLAAVPSIIFGLLGLSVFLGFFGMPRSAPLVGGFVLALMTLPTIIISARASIRAVPPSIKDAALGLGASKVQASFHHVLPLAMPGILTGTILGMAQALGETAPLIMIGMVAFIVDIPGGVTDSATVLPVQIFRWADFPERAFEARTALSICVLLMFLIAMNALAVFLRKRFERRW